MKQKKMVVFQDNGKIKATIKENGGNPAGQEFQKSSNKARLNFPWVSEFGILFYFFQEILFACVVQFHLWKTYLFRQAFNSG